MSALPPPPSARPKSTFVGGIRSYPFGWGASFPFGHLEFDEHELEIWGMDMRVRARRAEVLAIRLSIGALAVRVSVIGLDDRESNVYFAGFNRGLMREALEQRGWPVLDDHHFRRHRPPRA